MNKFLSFSAVLCLTLSTFASISDAQMINYKRRTTTKAVTPQASTTNATANTTTTQRVPQRATSYQAQEIETTQKKVESFADQFAKILRSEPQVTNRSERLYDFDRDGKLQEDELKDFLSDVVASVQRRGTFTINSEVLNSFDRDKDGRLSLYEVDAITQQIN